MGAINMAIITEDCTVHATDPTLIQKMRFAVCTSIMSN